MVREQRLELSRVAPLELGHLPRHPDKLGRYTASSHRTVRATFTAYGSPEALRVSCRVVVNGAGGGTRTLTTLGNGT